MSMYKMTTKCDWIKIKSVERFLNFLMWEGGMWNHALKEEDK
jgi:hypothetical protein